ncbi:MAG: TRAP transporter large permease subunit, partial [Spirochaetales bacterium]|nr:TRAP transporter large permease subunit [Spirochaetales bacterium]
KEYFVTTWQALGALSLPVVILGGIYGGIFTPTEAATVAVVYSLMLGVIYGEINLKTLKSAFIRTGETAAMVAFIVGSANLFCWLLSTTRLPVIITEAVIPIVSNKEMYLVLLTILLFIVGALMDTLASIVMLAPVVAPIGYALGVDPLHMAILFCVNLIVGFVTPPFGMNLFTACSISGLSFGQVVKGSLPYLLVSMFAVVLVTFIPSISLWLPTLAFGL